MTIIIKARAIKALFLSKHKLMHFILLPDGEKASSIECYKDSVVVLSSNGQVFQSSIDSNRVVEFLLNILKTLKSSASSFTNVISLAVNILVAFNGSQPCNNNGKTFGISIISIDINTML